MTDDDRNQNSSNSSTNSNPQLPKVYETGFISKAHFLQLQQCCSSVWAHNDSSSRFHRNNNNNSNNNDDNVPPWTGNDILQVYREQGVLKVSHRHDGGGGRWEGGHHDSRGGVYTVYPIPLPPEEYDPTYRPHFLLLHYIPHDILNASEQLERNIWEQWVQLFWISAILGVVGATLVLTMVWCVARKLTQPLLWIDSVAYNILHHHEQPLSSLKASSSSSSSSSVGDDDDDVDEEADVKDEEHQQQTESPERNESHSIPQPSPLWLCTPVTEIHQLVHEFERMVHGFSGTGASRVAECTLNEIPNELTWRSDFHQLYSYVVLSSAPPDPKKNPSYTPGKVMVVESLESSRVTGTNTSKTTCAPDEQSNNKNDDDNLKKNSINQFSRDDNRARRNIIREGDQKDHLGENKPKQQQQEQLQAPSTPEHLYPRTNATILLFRKGTRKKTLPTKRR